MVVRLKRKVAGIVGVVGIQSSRLSKRWVVRLRRRTGRRTIRRRSRGGGLRLVVTVVSLLVIAVTLLAISIVVVQAHVVKRGGRWRLDSASLGLRRRNGTDRDGSMERGLLRHALEQIGKGLRCDDTGIGEVFELLGFCMLDVAPAITGLRVRHTALMVRMERFTIAVCISSSGAIVGCDRERIC